MLYGILKTSSNTGADNEIRWLFSTPLNIISNQPAYTQDTMNLKRKTSSQNVQRWELEVSLNLSNGDPGLLVHTVQNGYTIPIYLRMPQIPNFTTSSGTITVAADIAAGTDTFSVAGATSMKAGEFIQFINHSKVYLVVEDGSAGAGVKVYPPLILAVSSGSTVITGGKVTLKAYYDNTSRLGISYSDGVMSNPGTFKFIETL
jgi:hypothetical protein